MKIVFDHQIFCLQQYGGISRYFYELAKNISAQEGHQVDIFAPLHINEYLKYNPKFHICGKRIPHFPFRGNISNAINTIFSRLLLKNRDDIDIFHETFFSWSDNCPRTAKRIVTVYDMIHEKFPEYFSVRENIVPQKARAVQRSDHVICISNNTRRDLIEFLNVPEEKISVVHLGYSLLFEPEPLKPIQHQKPFILYVGSRESYKNFELMLRAYSSSKSLVSEFSIICFGGGEITRKEKDLIASLNFPSDCLIWVNGNDSILASLYASAKALIYPSLYEGFGIPPLEAMAFGCPVICSNSSSIPEVVGNAAEMFDPASKSEIRNALEKVVFSPGHTELLVTKGYERIKLFSWKTCAQNTLAVYEKVLSDISRS